jgi:hypothetical protein
MKNKLELEAELNAAYEYIDSLFIERLTNGTTSELDLKVKNAWKNIDRLQDEIYPFFEAEFDEEDRKAGRITLTELKELVDLVKAKLEEKE